MTPEKMARIHAAAFHFDRSWSAQEFEDLKNSDFVTVYPAQSGFALTRLIAREAELLAIAVDPAQQNHGTGRRLLQEWLDDIADKADAAFLEVAADNVVAIYLYQSVGFQITATRRGYYTRKDAAAVDALVLSHPLTRGQQSDSAIQD